MKSYTIQLEYEKVRIHVTTPICMYAVFLEWKKKKIIAFCVIL